MGIEHKITGVFQLAAGAVILLYIITDGGISKSLAIGACLFFVAKGIGFTFLKRNPISSIDAIAGFYLLLSLILGILSNSIINWIAILFLLQKGVAYLFR